MYGLREGVRTLIIVTLALAIGAALPAGAEAQLPVVAKSARALSGAGKLSAALRAGRVTTAARSALLRDAEVVELLKNLDDPTVALYLRRNKEVETLARGLRQEMRLAMRTSPGVLSGSRCASGNPGL